MITLFGPELGQQPALPLLIPGRRCLTALLAALLATGLATAAASEAPAAQPTVAPQPRVLNYNTMLLTLSGDWDHDNRAERIANADFMKGNDVVVLEEVFRNRAPAAGRLLETLKRQGYRYQTPIVGTDSGKGTSDVPRWDEYEDDVDRFENGGVVIVSKYPIDYMAEHVYKTTPCGSDAYSEKGFAYVRIIFKGTPLHVFGTHTQSDDPGCEKSGDRSARAVRKKQFGEINDFVQKKGIPASEMVVFSGDMNVDRHSVEYADMLSALNAIAPDGNLGWQYSFDTQNNSIAKWRYGQKANVWKSDDPPQDLDYILLRKGNARPGEWNERVLTGQYDWSMSSGGHTWWYTDHSDHYPLVAGDVAEAPGTYELTVEKAVLKNFDDGSPDADVFGEIAITGSQGSGREHKVVWSKAYKDVTAHDDMKVGTEFPLNSNRTVRSDHGFAIHVDVMDYDAVGDNDTVSYGTAWWHNEDAEGRRTATLTGEDKGEIEVTYTVRKAD